MDYCAEPNDNFTFPIILLNRLLCQFYFFSILIYIINGKVKPYSILYSPFYMNSLIWFVHEVKKSERDYVMKKWLEIFGEKWWILRFISLHVRSMWETTVMHKLARGVEILVQISKNAWEESQNPPPPALENEKVPELDGEFKIEGSQNTPGRNRKLGRFGETCGERIWRLHQYPRRVPSITRVRFLVSHRENQK